MAAPSALMAIPSGAEGASVKSAKKQDHLNAGRRRLEAFKKKRREKENTVSNGAPDVPNRDEQRMEDQQQQQQQLKAEYSQILNGPIQPIELELDAAQVTEVDTARPIFQELTERSSNNASTGGDSAEATDARTDCANDGLWSRPSRVPVHQVSHSVADRHATLDGNLKQDVRLDEASNQDLDAPRPQSLPVETLQQGKPMTVTTCSKDDFAALEQHIEDLTQEKFSLQRGLETARTLVESLTQENTTLTEHYNQQGATINELRAEVEKYRAEFHAHQAMVEKLKRETDKALQESALATEQSRVFASEVISLEEKILKTRSQELKLQKEAEYLRDDIKACRKQISMMEKDRLNMKSMVEALQEEKKLLLVRLREAVSTAKVSDPSSQSDVSTSTDDLVVVSDVEGRPWEPATDAEHALATVSRLPTSIPAEQQTVIQSINDLVLELGREKTSLLEALERESSSVAQLRAENAELSQKLEQQTQQLELAVAQMAHGSSTPADAQATQPQVEFIDEADEVVDRVLQWIKKLFPGGSSSRRAGSKQL